MPVPGKQQIRKLAVARIRELPGDVRSAMDAAICVHILGSPAYRKAHQILSYAALADEVDLSAVRLAAYADGKRLFLPAVTPGEPTVTFHEVRLGEELREGFQGVPEPLCGDPPAAGQSLTLVPGRAFTAEGGRVGRGMGCYDRVLVDLKKLGPTAGVAYDCQLMDMVPVMEFDQDVDFVVTESGFRTTAGPGRVR